MKIAGCVAIAALNLVWHGHGILRSSPSAFRFAIVGVAGYVVATIAEFLWLLYSGPSFTGFESPTAAKGATPIASTDPLVEELKELPPAELAMRCFSVVLTGAKPIAQAADYLAGLARRLK